MISTSDFTFGLETEFLIGDRESYNPLWYTELTFQRLNHLLEKIPLDGIPNCTGLELEVPHKKLMPFVVEGYHLPDMNFNAVDILPKGIEIRTPICKSIQECLDTHQILFSRLQDQLGSDGLIAIALSHHPIESYFNGPQNKRRHDYWLWAMEVMTTYGPDINIGLPNELMSSINISDFTAKLNYYSASLAAFSLAAPFCEGKLWKIRGQIGKSLRTYRRSIIAPPIEIHPKENNRLEFKLFDMSTTLEDYERYFLLFLTIIIDCKLKGRASSATRIYDLGEVALNGWNVPHILARGYELLESAENTLPHLGFNTSCLNKFMIQLESRRVPADDLIELYLNNQYDLNIVLKNRTQIK